MNVAVIGGAGYVGLVTGVGLAEIGHQVVGVDVDQGRLDRLAAGVSPILEAGMDDALTRNLARGTLRFSSDLHDAVRTSTFVFIAVGTPAGDGGAADLSQVVGVIEDVARSIDGYTVVIIKSTVPVGTVEQVRTILGRGLEEGVDFDVVVNPEFLREGKGLRDFFYPDRIVIGTASERAAGLMRELYAPIVSREATWNGGPPAAQSSEPVLVIETGMATAQMIKYASNAFLATRVSFINEVAALCERVGADVTEVAEGMGSDPRIGRAYLDAGLGFGGPCLEKDLNALVNIGRGHGYDPSFFRAVLERNDRQIDDTVAKLRHLVDAPLVGLTIAAFGLAFKAGTNDVRSSLALRVVDRLVADGAQVRAHDPVAIDDARAIRPDLSYHEDPYDAVAGADALVILTEWEQFVALDYDRIRGLMRVPRILDCRNLLEPGSLRSLGYTYAGVGRP